MKEKNLTLQYSTIQTFFWMGAAIVGGLASVYLLPLGCSNTQIGIMTAAANVLCAFIQPAVASYADLPQAPSLRKLIRIISVLACCTAAAICFSHIFHIKIWMILVLYGACNLLQHVLNPLISSLGILFIDKGYKLNWGLARGLGSAGYGLIFYMLGALSDIVGTFLIPLTFLIIYVILIFLLPFYPDEKIKSDNKKHMGMLMSPRMFFGKYKKFCILLVGMVMVYASHVLINNFLYQIILSRGGAGSAAGLVAAIASFAEIPALILFKNIIAKISCRKILGISAFCFFLKTLFTLLSRNFVSLYFIQLLQIPGWAFMTAASVYYVNQIMDEDDAIKGQAYFTTSYTLASIVGALAGGFLLDLAGVNNMLAAACIISLAGSIIVWIFK